MKDKQLLITFALAAGRSGSGVKDTARFPSGALLMYHVWLCFPSFSTSWSCWGFVTCSWGSPPSLRGVLLTRGPRWAGQLCRVSVTTVPCGRSTNS
ncbi:hypothetical protein Q9966_001561 [Columba livia]|nr:hypothetical protein Q9966_001561 [Columba livia]